MNEFLNIKTITELTKIIETENKKTLNLTNSKIKGTNITNISEKEFLTKQLIYKEHYNIIISEPQDKRTIIKTNRLLKKNGIWIQINNKLKIPTINLDLIKTIKNKTETINIYQKTIVKLNRENNTIFLNKCNNNCIFCYQRKKETINYETFESIKNKFDKIKDDDIEFATFCGQESTINPDFLKIVDYLNHRNIWFILITNARILSSKQFTKELCKKGLMGIMTSLHGEDEITHDLITQSKNSFIQTVKGILNCKKEGISVNTNTVICKQNYKQLLNITKFLVNKLKVENVKLSGLINFKGNIDEIIIDYNTIKPELSKTINYLKQNSMKTEIEKLPLCIFSDEERENITYYLDNVEKEFPKMCNKCNKKEECMGIPKIYLKKYNTIGLKPFL